MRRTILSILRDEAGVAAAEFGLVAMIISLTVIGVARLLGTSLAATITAIANLF